MYKDLETLFGKGVTPSVKKFAAKLSKLTEQEQQFYHQAAREAAFCEWENLNVRYRTFLTNLFTRDWTRTLAFLHRQTVLGSLMYELQEPALLQRIVALLEGKKDCYNPSFIHLSFALHLSFSFPGSVEYFGDKLRTARATTDDLFYLMDLMHLDNESGHLPTGPL